VSLQFSCVEMRWFLVKIPHFSYLLITFTFIWHLCLFLREFSDFFDFFRVLRLLLNCFLRSPWFFCLYLVVFGFFGFLVLLFWSSLRFSFGFHSVSIRIPFGFHSVYIHSVSIRIPFGLLSVYIGFFYSFLFVTICFTILFSSESLWLGGALFLYYDEYIHKFTDSRRSICAEEVCWALGELEELWFTTCLNNWLGVLVDAPHTSLRRRSEGISSTRFGFSRADHFFVVSTV